MFVDVRDKEHANKHTCGYFLEGGEDTRIRRGDKRVFSLFCNGLNVYIYSCMSWVSKINFAE